MKEKLKDILSDKKKRLIALAGAGVLVVLLGCLVGFLASHVAINGRQYSRDIASLDLSGTAQPDVDQILKLDGLQTLNLRDTGLTAADYDRLHAALPGCAISWSVPFQGSCYPDDTTAITVTTLTMEDVAALDYLPGLQTVDATACRDYDALDALQARRPDCAVWYTVTVGGVDFREDTTVMALESADPAELEAAILRLPALERVTITGTGSDGEKMVALMAAYPQICFDWNFDVLGVTGNSLAASLDLTGATLENVEDLEKVLPYFYALERVDIYDRTVTSEEIDTMAKRHPETRFVWTVQVGRAALRTDVTTFMPHQYNYRQSRSIKDSELTELKYCVDMVCMDMGHMLITDCSYVAYMPNLQYLILADTLIKDFSALEGLTNLKYLEVFSTQFSDTSILPTLTSLEDLNISYTRVTDITPLLEMDHLQRLWCGGMEFGYKNQNALAEALPDTTIMYGRISSTGHGWRESPNYYAQRDLLGMNYMVG